MSNNSMHDVLDPAFKSSGKLNEALSDESQWDKATKTRMRKEVNNLKAMYSQVLEFKGDVPEDVIEGIEEVIVNTEARLDGQPMHFKSDVDSGEKTGAENLQAA